MIDGPLSILASSEISHLHALKMPIVFKHNKSHPHQKRFRRFTYWLSGRTETRVRENQDSGLRAELFGLTSQPRLLTIHTSVLIEVLGRNVDAVFAISLAPRWRQGALT